MVGSGMVHLIVCLHRHVYEHDNANTRRQLCWFLPIDLPLSPLAPGDGADRLRPGILFIIRCSPRERNSYAVFFVMELLLCLQHPVAWPQRPTGTPGEIGHVRCRQTPSRSSGVNAPDGQPAPRDAPIHTYLPWGART